jgi:hypothetical protein
MASPVKKPEWEAIKKTINEHPRSTDFVIGKKWLNKKRSSETVRLVRLSPSFDSYQKKNLKKHDTEWHHNRPATVKAKAEQESLFPIKGSRKKTVVVVRPLSKESREQREYYERIGNLIGAGAAALVVIALLVLIALVRSWR